MTSIIARWFIHKGRSRAAEVGVYSAAVQMRKQGVPFHIALAILAGTRA